MPSKDAFAKIEDREDIEDLITFDPRGIPVRSTLEDARATKRTVDVAFDLLTRLELFFRKRFGNRELTELMLMTDEHEIFMYQDKEINMILTRFIANDIVYEDLEPDVPHQYWDETSVDEMGDKKPKWFQMKVKREKRKPRYSSEDDSDDVDTDENAPKVAAAPKVEAPKEEGAAE
ncbi:hypothetical protein WDU94_013673 [Cyamophila willieti]